jgi:hypothetical protein
MTKSRGSTLDQKMLLDKYKSEYEEALNPFNDFHRQVPSQKTLVWYFYDSWFTLGIKTAL